MKFLVYLSLLANIAAIKRFFVAQQEKNNDRSVPGVPVGSWGQEHGTIHRVLVEVDEALPIGQRVKAWHTFDLESIATPSSAARFLLLKQEYLKISQQKDILANANEHSVTIGKGAYQWVEVNAELTVANEIVQKPVELYKAYQDAGRNLVNLLNPLHDKTLAVKKFFDKWSGDQQNLVLSYHVPNRDAANNLLFYMSFNDYNTVSPDVMSFEVSIENDEKFPGLQTLDAAIEHKKGFNFCHLSNAYELRSKEVNKDGEHEYDYIKKVNGFSVTISVEGLQSLASNNGVKKKDMTIKMNNVDESVAPRAHLSAVSMQRSEKYLNKKKDECSASKKKDTAPFVDSVDRLISTTNDDGATAFTVYYHICTPEGEGVVGHEVSGSTYLADNGISLYNLLGEYTDKVGVGKQHISMIVTFAVVLIMAIIVAFFYMPSCGGKDEESSSEEPQTDIEAVQESEDEKNKKNFRKFQMLYLGAWYLAIMGDWLQGPLYYEIPVEMYGWQEKGNRNFYREYSVFGFATAAIFGIFVGSITDTMGRKFACITYCFLNLITAMCYHFNSYYILAFGQVLNGIATRILFTAFESWYVHEHFKYGFSGNQLGASLGWMYFGSSLCAILAGLVAYAFSELCGHKAKAVYTNDMSATESYDGHKVGSTDDDNQMNWFGFFWGGPLYTFLLNIGILFSSAMIIIFTWSNDKKTIEEEQGIELVDNDIDGDEKTKLIKVEPEPQQPELRSSSARQGELYRVSPEQTKQPVYTASPRHSMMSVSQASDTEQPEMTVGGAVKECCESIKRDGRILLIGFSVALFEGSMYVFVVAYAGSFFCIDAFLNIPSNTHTVSIPLLFSALMLAFLTGSCLFNFFVNLMPARRFAWCVMALGGIGLALPAIALFYLKGNVKFADGQLFLPGSDLDKSGTVLTLQIIAYVGFLIFELAVGAYFPCMGGIKADLVPERVRTTMYNLFYVPMNILLCLVLLINLTGLQVPDEVMLCIAIGALSLACLLTCVHDCLTSKKDLSTKISLLDEQ